MVRKFLYVVVALIVLATAAAFAYRLWGVGMMRMAMVPGESFRDQDRMTAQDYASNSHVMNDSSQKASDSKVATTMPRIGSLGATSASRIDAMSVKDGMSE